MNLLVRILTLSSIMVILLFGCSDDQTTKPDDINKKERDANRFYIIYFASLLLVIYIVFGYIGQNHLVILAYANAKWGPHR